jgi:hypothetical protein
MVPLTYLPFVFSFCSLLWGTQAQRWRLLGALIAIAQTMRPRSLCRDGSSATRRSTRRARRRWR